MLTPQIIFQSAPTHPPYPHKYPIFFKNVKFLHAKTWHFRCTTLSFIMPKVVHTLFSYHFLQAQFFSAEPTFFSRSDFFLRVVGMWVGSAGSPPWLRVEINDENLFSGIYLHSLTTIGRQPSHPRRTTFFVRFMPQSKCILTKSRIRILKWKIHDVSMRLRWLDGDKMAKNCYFCGCK